MFGLEEFISEALVEGYEVMFVANLKVKLWINWIISWNINRLQG